MFLMRWLAAVSVASASPAVTLDAPPTLLAGERPHVQVRGLPPRARVTVETFRTEPVAVNTAGKWSTDHPLFHAQATFQADARGRVRLDDATPEAGTYLQPDPRGLLWSGRVVGRAPEPAAPADIPELQSLKPGRIRWVVRVAGRPVAIKDTEFAASAGALHVERIDTPTLVGVYAAPEGATRAPAVIYLHGSEGGDFSDAQQQALRYASRGFATMALIYFSWPYKGLANAPPGFTNLPLERLATARDWLSRRPEADVDRLAVVGASKGAEFGLLAATKYPWIRKLVACVPSSLVWGGFGGAPGAPSFTWEGRPVPAVPYGDYGPVDRHEITSAERHRRDRAAAASTVIEAATIPVERIKGSVLLLSGGRDAVWPSSSMAAEIASRAKRFGMNDRVRWLDFPDAGHFICGTGDFPTRYFESDEIMSAGGTAEGNGEAGGRAWEATVRFLRQGYPQPTSIRPTG